MHTFSRFKLFKSVNNKKMEVNSPNWLEMPDAVMAHIFERLSTVEILNGPRKVCRTWRRICKDPAMWKVIDILKPLHKRNMGYNIEMLTKQVVDLSCGELIDISIEGFGTERLLYYIVRRSRKLKRLCIMYSNGITGKGVSRAVKMVPRLEKLHLSLVSVNAKDIQVIGRNCPQLKSFTLNKKLKRPPNDDDALAIAKNMPELRHLRLFGSQMTNNGLRAINRSLRHLESFDYRMCFNLDLGRSSLRLFLQRIIELMRSNDSTENCFYRRKDELYAYIFGHSDVDTFFRRLHFRGGE